MDSLSLAGLVFSAVPVRGGSEWVFVELSDSDGVTGAAEITGPGAATKVASALASLADRLRGEEITDEARVGNLLGLSMTALQRDPVLATAVSGLRSAILDIRAQRAGVGLVELLAGQPARSVELYANINRSMLPDDHGPVDRSPAAFARAAVRAVRDGFGTVKCAPFDEARTPFRGGGLPPEAAPGLARITAVREAIGDSVTLLVDCHSRFDLTAALALARELHRLHVAWFEEPLDPLADPDGLARVRAAADMPVAGAEHGYGGDLFASLIERGALDVVMPDVKYCGGVGEAAEAGRQLERRQAGSVSLHCPSGPISLLASAHATLAFRGARPLEHAVAEVPWRAGVIEPAERVENGTLVIPGGPGLGAGLDHAFIAAHGRRWTV